MVENNPHKISTMGTGSSLAAITDASDFPHTGLIKGLSQLARQNIVVRNNSNDFDITQASSGNVVQVSAGTYLRDGKLFTASAANFTIGTTSNDTSLLAHSQFDKGYHLLVVNSSNAIKMRQPTVANKVPDYTSGDTIIAVIEISSTTSDGSRNVQFLTTDKAANSLSIAYDNSNVYTETMSVIGDGDRTTFKNKIANADIRFVLADNTADEKFEILTDDDSDGDEGDTSVFSVDGLGAIAAGSLTYNQEDLILSSAAAQLQVKDTTNNYAVTVKGGGGPRVQFGDTDSSVDSFMDMGAYGGINNIDTQSRDFKIHGTTSANHFYIDENEAKIGIGTNTPSAKLHVIDSGSGDHLILEGTLGSSTTSAPNLVLFRNGADAAADIDDADLIGQIVFRGENDNSTPQEVNYATIEAGMDDTTDGSEDGHITFNLIEAGTLTEFMRLRSATRDVVVNEQADDIDFRCEGSSDANLLFVDASADKVGIGLNAPKTKLTVEGAITLKEQVSADADTAAYGQLWTKTATPNELYFTNDAGNDIQLTTGAKGPLLQGKHTIWVPSSAMTPTTTAGCSDLTLVEMTAGRPELQVLDFAADADDHAQFTVAFPKSWDEGTVTFQPFWTVTGTNTGDVEWNLTGISMANSAVINTTYPSASVSAGVAHSGTSNDMNVGAVCNGLTITNAAVDTVTYFKLSNDTSSSTQTGVARLIGIKLFYTSNAGNDE